MATKKDTKRLVTESALRIVKIADIQVDKSYQRDVVPGHKKIVAAFDEHALGVPLVAEREDGSLWIVDGLQRITALKIMGKKTVRAEVFASSGPEYEAQIFKLVNVNRTPLRTKQIWFAMLTAGDVETWAIKKIIEGCGFKVDHNNNNSRKVTPSVSNLECCNTLRAIYRRGKAESLEFCLNVIKQCWENDVMRTKGDILLGLHYFYQRRKGEVDIDRLVPRLNKTTPAKIIYSASLGIGDRGSNIADAIERVYRRRTAV